MVDFFLFYRGRSDVWLDRGCLLAVSVCAFSQSTHVKMLTCFINLQVCVCAYVLSMCYNVRSKMGGGCWGTATADFGRSEPLFSWSLWRCCSWGGKNTQGKQVKRAESFVTIPYQILNRLKSSYKLKDSHWEMVFAHSIRIYHLHTGRGTIWGGNALPLISLSLEVYQGPLLL